MLQVTSELGLTIRPRKPAYFRHGLLSTPPGGQPMSAAADGVAKAVSGPVPATLPAEHALLVSPACPLNPRPPESPSPRNNQQALKKAIFRSPRHGSYLSCCQEVEIPRARSQRPGCIPPRILAPGILEE